MTPGPTSVAVRSDGLTAGQLFCRCFTDEVWDLLVMETNCHADAVRGTTPHSRPWTTITVDEMKAFIGLLILMAMCKLPRLECTGQIII